VFDKRGALQMWNQELYRMTKRRLWHADIVKLLANVVLDATHSDRENLPAACIRRMNSVAESVRNCYS
jgi:hypothetical protein